MVADREITTGAPKMDVTVLMFSSVGAKAVRAMRSHSIQNTPPPKNVAGMTTSGLDVFRQCRMRNGTAMPTNEIGPANAVTQAASRLDSSTSTTENARTGTPTLAA